MSNCFACRFAPLALMASVWSLSAGVSSSRAAEPAAAPAIQAALERAGENRAELTRALERVPADQRDGLEFLVINMPDRDLRSLTADFLIENCELAYSAWRAAPWKDKLPKEVFLNNVLPYANINERRDAWRKDFRQRFQPLVAEAKSPGHAAAILNQKVFGMVNVRYSTGRPKADQSPYESMQAGLASCSGLAVLLVDACRAVGVPARFAGTPRWTDNSGNHSWVEVWDDGWHFTGAAEPSGDKLDEAWFIARASSARRDHPLHAIYAVSFQRTPQKFPLVWDPKIDYVYAVNVTDRYAGRAEPLAADMRRVQFRALSAGGDRCAAPLKIEDESGKAVFEGRTNDERFDANDHLTVALRAGAKYRVEAQHQGARKSIDLAIPDAPPLVTVRFDAPDAASGPVELLKKYLAAAEDARPPLAEQAFAKQALRREEAAAAERLLWDDHAARIRRTRAAEIEQKKIKLGELEMPFEYKTFGTAPADGRSLYLSLHGGGGAPKQVNDQQWRNQQRLYEVPEGIYLAPRAPTNTWNLWHEAHIDQFFDRLIEDLIVLENVNPDRVYVMGYSAGGDGVYQIAPRMADRWAAASMMAGHPNEASPLGLRNLPFSMHVGGNDAAYNRNAVAKSWGEQLAKLREADPKGYENWVKIYEGKGHWLDREDAAAVPWMAKFRRNPDPQRVVWWQDDVTQSRYYWLTVQGDQRKAGTKVVATRDGQKVDLEATGVQRLTVRWNDRLADLDQPVTVTSGGKTLFAGKPERTIATLAATLAERGDPRGVFSAETTVTLSE